MKMLSMVWGVHEPTLGSRSVDFFHFFENSIETFQLNRKDMCFIAGMRLGEGVLMSLVLGVG